MEIRMIDTFLRVAATQNFSKAAAQLGYSQSAVTVQMQHLEEELGVPLFERVGKRVYLTEKGQEFIPYASDIMKSTHAAMEFSKKSTGAHGVLRIGGVESICTALLPKLLLKFHALCPDVEVVIRAGATNDLIELASANELDLICTLDEKIYRPQLRCAAEKEEEIVFVTLGNGLQAEDEILTAKDLCRKPLILTETGAAYRYELERQLAARELEIRPILEIGNTETIIKLLKKGMGISFLPRFTVQNELNDGVLREIHTDLPGVTMYHQLLFFKSKWITHQMEVFINLVEAYFSGTLMVPAK